MGVTIDEAAVPLADGVREYHCERGHDPVQAALAGGDDYELLFTARPSLRGRLRAVRQHVGDVPITRIGVVTKARAKVTPTVTHMA